MSYNFTSRWLKGTKNEAADALSRHPHNPPTEGDDLAEHKVDIENNWVTIYEALSIVQIWHPHKNMRAYAYKNFRYMQMRIRLIRT